MPVWNRIKDDQAGYAYSLSDAMSLLDWRFPGYLQDLSSDELVIASDYSGQHREATHESHSFLLTNASRIRQWDTLREQFRANWLPDGRRMSFKRLSDRIRRRALEPFLELAFSLKGNLVTVMIEKHVESFCGDIDEMIRVFDNCFPDGTPKHTINKMYTLSTLLAMIVVGFCREDQLSHWISDEDETLDTFDKREGIATLMTYLTFGFARWKAPADQIFGTTGSPHAPSWAEDLAAIPDLMAGTTCVLADVLPRFFDRKEVQTHMVHSQDSDDARAKSIMNWIGKSPRPLRCVQLRLERDDKGDVRASYQAHFSNAPR